MRFMTRAGYSHSKGHEEVRDFRVRTTSERQWVIARECMLCEVGLPRSRRATPRENGQTMLFHKCSKNATTANERSHFGADYVKILSKSVFRTLQTRQNGLIYVICCNFPPKWVRAFSAVFRRTVLKFSEVFRVQIYQDALGIPSNLYTEYGEVKERRKKGGIHG